MVDNLHARQEEVNAAIQALAGVAEKHAAHGVKLAVMVFVVVSDISAVMALAADQAGWDMVATMGCVLKRLRQLLQQQLSRQQ